MCGACDGKPSTFLRTERARVPERVRRNFSDVHFRPLRPAAVSMCNLVTYVEHKFRPVGLDRTRNGPADRPFAKSR